MLEKVLLFVNSKCLDHMGKNMEKQLVNFRKKTGIKAFLPSFFKNEETFSNLYHLVNTTFFFKNSIRT